MRPILLQGHTKSLTMIRYNREGDLLFTTAKDNEPSVWFSSNGERLGTFVGHNGAVWCLDVNHDTTRLITGSGDSTAKLWEVETGKELHTFVQNTGVRSVRFSLGARMALVVTDRKMGKLDQIFVYPINANLEGIQDPIAVVDVPKEMERCTVADWVAHNQYIITGHADGEICLWNWKENTKVKSERVHSGLITDIQFSKDKSHFVTSSKDYTAKIVETKTLKVLKVFQTERPVNSASMSELKDHVILGGGQEASQVTTTSTRQGKFEVRFFHKIFGDEIGRVKGHFGPINTVAFHPSGKSFASGGEDGYVRLHHFDPDYFRFEIEH